MSQPMKLSANAAPMARALFVMNNENEMESTPVPAWAATSATASTSAWSVSPVIVMSSASMVESDAREVTPPRTELRASVAATAFADVKGTNVAPKKPVLSWIATDRVVAVRAAFPVPSTSRSPAEGLRNRRSSSWSSELRRFWVRAAVIVMNGVPGICTRLSDTANSVESSRAPSCTP